MEIAQQVNAVASARATLLSTFPPNHLVQLLLDGVPFDLDA
jgi:hypothetical protein